MFKGDLKEYYSADFVIDDDKSSLYPTEFLHSINISGMPPHKLQLKEGQPIILLRNVDPLQGLCNGTRLICKRFFTKLIQAEIATGAHRGEKVYLTRMPLTPSDTDLPFAMKRIQFPIRPAFAMTISKSQGQTLDFVGLWLDEPLFTHGQLYVAMSRVSSPHNIKISLNATKTTRNVVYKSVLLN